MSRASSLYPSPYSLSRYRTVFLAASICMVTLFAGVFMGEAQRRSSCWCPSGVAKRFRPDHRIPSKPLRQPLAAL